ncbi:MAG TPA: NosD domain-containing protein [Balneolales bacterium]|nr:NosD domain-containing protein [Balneolales bacterium]
MKLNLNPFHHKPGTYLSRNNGILELFFIILVLFPRYKILAQNISVNIQSHILFVAPPSDDQMKDHNNIATVLRQAQPGDTIQFGRGQYTVGEIIRVPTPHLTLLGDAKGTVLRGCSPDAYVQEQREEVKVIRQVIKSKDRSHIPTRMAELVKSCGMFQLTGGHDTVRDLTFEYMRLGLMLGYEPQQGYRPSDGGYLVEGNTFRNSDNGIRVGLSLPEPTLIRHNTFVDTYHAVEAGGSNIHILDNTILAPAPRQVPAVEYPGGAIGITAIAPVKGTPGPANGRCDKNLIAGNLIDGYVDGIGLHARPGTGCHGNVIRNNTIVVRRVTIPQSSVFNGLFPLRDPAHPSYVGIPISVSSYVSNGQSGSLSDNLIEGNRILGAEGYGIGISHASDNRIENNIITGIILLKPFPGNGGYSPNSRSGNGAGIWVSKGSDGNEITGNIFRDIATYSIVLEGNHNIVRFRLSADSVHNLGSGNHVEWPHKR